MNAIFKSLEDEGYEFEVEVGWKEKDRRKSMSNAIKKIKESGDDKNIMFAKRLARYYGIFNNIGYITTNPDITLEEDKYGLNYIHIYLENFVDSAKRCIDGVMTALANDEPLESFYKKLMLTHLFTPEEIAEIDREELNRKKKSFA